MSLTAAQKAVLGLYIEDSRRDGGISSKPVSTVLAELRELPDNQVIERIYGYATRKVAEGTAQKAVIDAKLEVYQAIL